ncbi:hypothetical protein DsansV1_C20g0164031 [Dioscorea sansibarensis]
MRAHGCPHGCSGCTLNWVPLHHFLHNSLISTPFSLIFSPFFFVFLPLHDSPTSKGLICMIYWEFYRYLHRFSKGGIRASSMPFFSIIYRNHWWPPPVS